MREVYNHNCYSQFISAQELEDFLAREWAKHVQFCKFVGRFFKVSVSA